MRNPKRNNEQAAPEEAKAPSENVEPAAKKAKAAAHKKTKSTGLSKKGFEQQFQGVLLQLSKHREISQNLYTQLKEMLNSQLNVVYEMNEKVRLASKAAFQADTYMAAAKIKSSKPLFLTVTGSVGRVVSDVSSVNAEQKELFQEILNAKLFEPTASGKNLPLDKALSEKLSAKVDALIGNMTNLRKELARGLTFIYGKSSVPAQGKGWTLEHGKDLKNPHQLSLQHECQKLLQVLDKQIEMNNTLKSKLGHAGPEADVQSTNKLKK